MFSNFVITSLLQAMTAIQNMAHHYREFQSRLDDAKRLRLYAQSSVSKHKALDAYLAKEESMLKHWKQEAKAGAKKIGQAEKERDEAKQETTVARLVAIATDGWRLRLPV